MEVWFSSRKVQKAMAKIRPKYLARSPVSIRKAMKFKAEPPFRVRRRAPCYTRLD
jgi:hypothetical protein